MRLVLLAPEGWESREIDGRQVLVVPGGADPPDLTIDVDPLVLLPDNRQQWLGGIILRDIAEGTNARVMNTLDTATDLGWPMQLVHEVLLSPEAKLLETRLVAIYRFFEYGAAALVRGRNEERYEANRPKLLEVLASGRPDWRGPEVVALADLWAWDGQVAR
jgi:hypothetical protein